MWVPASTVTVAEVVQDIEVAEDVMVVHMELPKLIDLILLAEAGSEVPVIDNYLLPALKVNDVISPTAAMYVKSQLKPGQAAGKVPTVIDT